MGSDSDTHCCQILGKYHLSSGREEGRWECLRGGEGGGRGLLLLAFLFLFFRAVLCYIPHLPQMDRWQSWKGILIYWPWVYEVQDCQSQEYLGISKNLQESLEMIKNLKESARISKNLQEYSPRIFKNLWKFPRIIKNLQESPRISRNLQESLGISENLRESEPIRREFRKNLLHPLAVKNRNQHAGHL